MKRVVCSLIRACCRYRFPLALMAVAIVCGGGNFLLAAESISVGETVRIASKVLGEERTLLISTPANYTKSSERYPVFYMTDGDSHLLHTRGTLDFLARNGRMPDCILVGVTNTDRNRDLTPTRWNYQGEDGSRFAMPSSGGADKFLDFFAQELFPYIESHYRTSPYRIFAGHSLGGLLALHILATRHELFQACIAVSPSLNWDDGYPLRAVAKFLQSQKECRRTLFVSMANEESGSNRPTRLDRLKGILGASETKGFIWDSRQMEDEDHGSVVLRSHYWGLRLIFRDWQLPASPGNRPFAGTLEEFKAHYAGLSRRMEYAVLPPEQTVNLFGYQLLGRRKAEEAIAVFRYNVELYPESANVYDSLGEALEGSGRVREAHENYASAVEKAARIGDSRLAVYTRNRDRTAAAVK